MAAYRELVVSEQLWTHALTACVMAVEAFSRIEQSAQSDASVHEIRGMAIKGRAEIKRYMDKLAQAREAGEKEILV